MLPQQTKRHAGATWLERTPAPHARPCGHIFRSHARRRARRPLPSASLSATPQKAWPTAARDVAPRRSQWRCRCTPNDGTPCCASLRCALPTCSMRTQSSAGWWRGGSAGQARRCAWMRLHAWAPKPGLHGGTGAQKDADAGAHVWPQACRTNRKSTLCSVKPRPTPPYLTLPVFAPQAPWLWGHWEAILPEVERRLGLPRGAASPCDVDALWQVGFVAFKQAWGLLCIAEALQLLEGQTCSSRAKPQTPPRL
jgi:hypothetical protein